MEKFRTLRGFKDILGTEIQAFRRIESTARKYFEVFGYDEIEIPVLEKTELFVRSIGDTTDIVEKEMFTFIDLGGDSVTLRPEATAGVVRAYLQAGLYAKERASKVFTIGPMFRHEKPQKGRFREFHQVDVEVFGIDSAVVDAEMIWMLHLILADLGVARYDVEVNSVGCRACREEFRKVLISYFGGEKTYLCEDCLRRLDRNPLRIFDCKQTQCIEVAGKSPLLFDYLCESCKVHFDSLLDHLEGFGVPVKVNKRLVRGLDYYTKTVFEIISGDLGAQKAFAAGGRYDGLVEEMGGPVTPGSGFAIGVERLSLLMGEETGKRLPCCFFAYLGDKAKAHLVPLLRSFIGAGLPLRYSYEDKSLKAQMRYADSLGSDYVLILGEDEINRGVVVLRNMRNKGQTEFPLDLSLLPAEILRLAAE
jgi:histidyl-tRNA synthetase